MSYRKNSTTRTVIEDIQRSGVALAGIAKVLEARGVKTPAGRSTWQPAQVARVVAARRAAIARAELKMRLAE